MVTMGRNSCGYEEYSTALYTTYEMYLEQFRAFESCVGGRVLHRQSVA
jgi:hypothetical protein